MCQRISPALVQSLRRDCFLVFRRFFSFAAGVLGFSQNPRQNGIANPPCDGKRLLRFLRIRLRRVTGIPDIRAVWIQRCSVSQARRQSGIHLSDQIEQFAEAMSSWELDLMPGQESLEAFLSRLLCAEADGIEKWALDGEQCFRRVQVLLGLGNPLLHKLPLHLVRRPHRSPSHTCWPDRRCRR